MPELPEVETVVRQLAKVLPGKVIRSMEVLRAKSLQGEALQAIEKTIESVERKQKIIVIKLQDTTNKTQDLVLLVHLKMTGQLILVPSDSSLVLSGEKPGTRIVGGHPSKDWVGNLPSKHTRVVIHFTDGSSLYFNDQRVFGWVKVSPVEQWLALSKRMAPDVVDEQFSVTYLGNALKKSTRAVKLVILDQDKMGGMGNIYANDALFLAGINPKKAANQLKQAEVKKLHRAMVDVLYKGIETGGASYSHFVDTEGIGGHYQDHFLVYDKEGQSCLVCQGIIHKTSLGGRGTYWCLKCQV